MTTIKWGLGALAAIGVFLLLTAQPRAEGGVGNPACGTNPGHAGHGTPLLASSKNQLAA